MLSSGQAGLKGVSAVVVLSSFAALSQQQFGVYGIHATPTVVNNNEDIFLLVNLALLLAVIVPC